jgi:magnesium transporter
MATWHDIRDPGDPLLDELAVRYNLHPLHIEDCRNRNQSAKVEEQGGYLFVVLKPVDSDADGVVSPIDLDFFIGPDFLITVQEAGCGLLTELLDRMRKYSAQEGSDQLFYRIMDGVIDMYLPVLDRISDRIDILEEKALECPEPVMMQQLFELKRTLLVMRRILANSRDVLGHLLRTSHTQIRSELMPYLRDVYDHIARSLDNVEVQRDLVTGAVEVYLTSVANRTNQVMKVLTIFGTIATPALVITGMYGMNLKHLPFAEHPHSWGIVMSLIASVSLLMLGLLRWFRWL